MSVCPEMDGIELQRRVKQPYPRLPVILSPRISMTTYVGAPFMAVQPTLFTRINRSMAGTCYALSIGRSINH